MKIWKVAGRWRGAWGVYVTVAADTPEDALAKVRKAKPECFSSHEPGFRVEPYFTVDVP